MHSAFVVVHTQTSAISGRTDLQKHASPAPGCRLRNPKPWRRTRENWAPQMWNSWASATPPTPREARGRGVDVGMVGMTGRGSILRGLIYMFIQLLYLFIIYIYIFDYIYFILFFLDISHHAFSKKNINFRFLLESQSAARAARVVEIVSVFHGLSMRPMTTCIICSTPRSGTPQSWTPLSNQDFLWEKKNIHNIYLYIYIYIMFFFFKFWDELA